MWPMTFRELLFFALGLALVSIWILTFLMLVRSFP